MARDHDWQIIASRDPYFGVLTDEAYRSNRIDDEARTRFYQSGVATIAMILDRMQRTLGARPVAGHALDVGCGVGRLAYAMAAEMTDVTGYDVSTSMVDIARAAAPPNLQLTTTFPAGSFDWINSYIVFQHIPPDEGLALLDRCLAAAADHAFLSIHFSLWNDLPPPSRKPQHRVRAWLRRRAGRTGAGPLTPLIRMYDYDLGEVVKRLVLQGFKEPALLHEQHGAHHGVWIFARRP